MSTTDEHGTPQVDDKARERSAEQRNITAPTPKDVRAKVEKEKEEAPPAADTQSP